MKFFSKGKKADSNSDLSGENDSASVSSAEGLDESEAQNRGMRGPSQIPMAVLARKLGMKAGEIEDDFFLGGGSACTENKVFYNNLNEKSGALLKKLSAAESLGNGFSADMSLEIGISDDRMSAFGCLFPPIGAGKELSAEQLTASAQSAGIRYGLNGDLLRKLAEEKTFFSIFTLAAGKAALDGEDGRILDIYPREKQISLEADEKKRIDFKNLNLVQNVRRGDVICQIVPPVPPEDGVDVQGVVHNGRTGIIPRPPMGKNVVESEDHTALLADCEGQLIFSCGCFKVQQMLLIENDVDSSTGNLDVIGSITIKGNVKSGYTVKATEDILVRGNVEAAELVAGGSIQVLQGINGNFQGKVSSGADVKSRYLENCSVTAGGTVITDSLVNCTVISSDHVVVTTGKGIILGGSVFGLNGIEANTIGNEQQRRTNLTIGADPKVYYELSALNKEIHELTHKAEENDKNILYMQTAENLDAKYRQLLEILLAKQATYKADLTAKSERAAAIEAEVKGTENCQITANRLYPPVNVTIGSNKLAIDTMAQMCRIYKSEGEIIIGKK